MRDKRGRHTRVGDSVRIVVSGPGPHNEAKVEGTVKLSGEHSIYVAPALDTDELADLYARLGVDDPVELAEIGEVLYEGEPAGVEILNAPVSRAELDIRLQAFQLAASALELAWDEFDGDAIENYPPHWKDFAEELTLIQQMTVRN